MRLVGSWRCLPCGWLRPSIWSGSPNKPTCGCSSRIHTPVAESGPGAEIARRSSLGRSNRRFFFLKEQGMMRGSADRGQFTGSRIINSRRSSLCSAAQATGDFHSPSTGRLAVRGRGSFIIQALPITQNNYHTEQPTRTLRTRSFANAAQL